MTVRTLIASISSSISNKNLSSPESSQEEQEDPRKFIHLEVLKTGKIHEIFQMTLNFLLYFSTKLPSEDRALPTMVYIKKQTKDVPSPHPDDSSPLSLSILNEARSICGC